MSQPPESPQPIFGTFATPAIGMSSLPIPLSDNGYCMILDDGLLVNGRRTRFAQMRIYVFWLSCFFMFSTVISIFATFRLDLEWGFWLTVILGLILHKYMMKSNSVELEPWEFIVPWTSITKIRYYEEHLIFTIKKNKPKGEIYFVPRTMWRDFWFKYKKGYLKIFLP